MLSPATLLITDHHIKQECIRIINFYHDVNNPLSLRTLTSLELDPEVPTILVGDFNALTLLVTRRMDSFTTRGDFRDVGSYPDHGTPDGERGHHTKV